MNKKRIIDVQVKVIVAALTAPGGRLQNFSFTTNMIESSVLLLKPQQLNNFNKLNKRFLDTNIL